MDLTPAPALLDPEPRANLHFLVYETGKLDGKFTLLVDLDSTTTRALGQFLIELADQTDAHKN
jgi:hypothetical protein